MLPIYNAISFQEMLTKGGRTKPWVVLVNVNGVPTPYVVKLFDTGHIETSEPVVNEVVGNYLAKEFGFLTPDAALIEFDYSFEATIKGSEAIHFLELKDERIKFGCKYVNNPKLFPVSALTAGQARNIIDIDSVFGFDILIRNRDRNSIKQNLLLGGRSEAYLIDHEAGFEINSQTANDVLQTRSIPDNVYCYHLFYDYLRKSRKSTRKQYFNEFDEHLHVLNTKKINGYLNQLNRFGYSTKKHQIVLDYLEKMKSNRGIFVNILKGLI